MTYKFQVPAVVVVVVPPWQQARERPICVGPWSPLPAGMTRLRAALALKPRCNTVRIKSAVRRVSRSLDSNASQSLVETPTVPFNWIDGRSCLIQWHMLLTAFWV